MKKFEAANAQLLGLSCDPWPALKVWAASMGGVGHPLLSDFYPRSVTVIDPQGVVRAFHTYPGGVLPDPEAVLAELIGLQKG